MALIGLIAALVGVVLLWSRWTPPSGPAAAPRAAPPIESIDRARQATEAIDAHQKRQADEVNRMLQP